MLRSSPPPGFRSTSLALAVLALLAPAVAAQQATRPSPIDHAQFGIGYVANLPDLEVGGAGYVILPRWGGIGVYVDAKVQVSGPPKETAYDPSVTAEQIENDVGGNYIRTEGTWWSVNAAVLRPLSPYFTVYLGGGVAHETSYRQYDQIDRNLGIGVGGVVWAEDPRATESRANLMVGMITRLTSRLSAHFGYETQPDGVTAGLTLRLPRW